jgi:acyl carrier protein
VRRKGGDVADRQTLRECFRAGLDLPADVDVDALEYRSIEQWDSVGHMALVAQIEDTFGVMLDTDQVIGMSSFSEAVETLAEHGVVLD